MTTDPSPILFLAFANDRDDRARYLRNLAEEARQVRAALDVSVRAGHCEVIERTNATLDEILDVFQDGRYRQRIAIFHFGGHADSYELLFESAEGKPTTVDAAAFANFLGHQARGSLQLVVLNGCSTRQQVAALLDAGVSAVIATSQDILDQVATDFARRFYTGLAGGNTIGDAFGAARSSVQAATGSDSRKVKLVRTNLPQTDGWPWELHIRPGDEVITAWSLPKAARDPLFGLPEPSRLDLPDKPYRYLDWYRREDAAVFFGRGREIRQLYERVTARDGAPIVLLYGQSGVGKSSLLAAGLQPRLEGSHTVRYARRDQALGLAGTLAAAVETGPDADLAAAWRKMEAEAGRPLLVILDQVEELFTRPNREQPDEMAALLTAAMALFGDPGRRPAGRLFLSFRKEWLAEIKQRLGEATLPFTEVFLERLDRAGIVEIVTGPSSTVHLRSKYGQEIGDPLLPGLIADDLLADRESPIAPMLAILLADMWDAARARSYERPTFDDNLYHEFRSRGLSLGDFLGRQLQALHVALPEAVYSGLALDLLAHHTTPLGTAEQRTLADLEQTYQHRQDVLPALVQECRDLYLLVDPTKNQPSQPPASRLTHDTLGPQVRKRFDESDAPGQRARRILESRAASWRNGSDSVTLDDLDLNEVERGMVGTRSWSVSETKLLEASRVAQQRRASQRRLRRVLSFGAIATIASALLIVVFLAQRWTITRQTEKIVRAERIALSAKDAVQRDRELALLLAIAATSQHQSWVTDDALRTTLAEFNSGGLSVQAEVQSWSPDGRYVAGRIEKESAAVFLTQSGELVKQFAVQGQYSEQVPGAPSVESFIDGGSADPGLTMVRSPLDDWSPNGKYLLVLPDHTTVAVWSTDNWLETTTLIDHSDEITEAAWNPQGTQIATASNDATARLWSFPSSKMVHVLRGHTGPIKDVAWNRTGDRIATASLDKTVRVWNASTGEQELVFENGEPLGFVSWDPTGRYLVSTDLELDSPDSKVRPVIHVLDTKSKRKVLELPTDEGPLIPFSANWSPSGAYLVVASADYKTTLVWDTSTWASQILDGTRPRWSPLDDRLLLETGEQDSEIMIWDVDTGKEISRFRLHYGQIYSAEWDKDGRSVASTGADGFLRVWNSTDSIQQVQIRSGFEERHYAEWNPNSRQVAVRDQSGALTLYDLTIREDPQRHCELLTRNLSEAEWATYVGTSEYQAICPGKPVPGIDIPIDPTPGSTG